MWACATVLISVGITTPLANTSTTTHIYVILTPLYTLGQSVIHICKVTD